jgi:hypothetical protein
MRFFFGLFLWSFSAAIAAAAGVDDPIDLLTPRLPVKGNALPNAKPSPVSNPTSAATMGIAPYDRLAKGNILVESHVLTSGSEDYIFWYSRWGSYSKSCIQKKLVEIRLSGIGNSGAPAVVEFFRVLRINNREICVQSEGQNIKSDGQGTWCVQLTSESYEVYYKSLGIREQIGLKMVGYFVRVMRDNRIVGYFAAPSAYERFALDPKNITR